VFAPIKVILIDDELNALANLKNLVGKYCPDVEIIDMASGVDSASMLINHLKPDAIFLDISMPRKNGFELLSMLDHKPYVVFVTAHEEYALKAIKACAVDFLLKPVDVNELTNVGNKLQRLKQLSENLEFKAGYDNSLVHLTGMLQTQEPLKTITVTDAMGYQIIETDKILYLEGSDNYTFIHIDGQNKLVASRTLKDFEMILQDNGFLRIHKSSIINLKYLKSLQQKPGLSVVMMDGKEFAVSRRRGNYLMEKARHLL